MAGRGGKRRGRPPKTTTNDRFNKFNYHLLKKPRYLSKAFESQFSTPSASRASSPQESESSRRSLPRPSATKSPRGRRKRGVANSYANTSCSRKGYESEYHYGSDFADSTDKSDVDDDPLLLSPSEEESIEGDHESDSDFSVSSFNQSNGVGRPPRPPSPDPVWLQDRDITPLELPDSSEDLLISKELSLKAVTVYEVLRRFRNLVRLSPFRLEDFCAALVCEEQSSLLAEIHIMLLKAILREEDMQATHFGPLDQKDSVNISLYLMDTITWPEVLRSYVESDNSFDKNVLHILSTKEYPYTNIEDRLIVLQFLTDQFLITTSVRDDLLQEGPIHYDDHCRICHRLGDLLCCETCPAVFHLECVDPPLVDVPSEDWQCSICKAHKVTGVVDCISSHEKQGILIRHDILGYDRHGRKFWFVGRRIFVEDQGGQNVWYYSTETQLNLLLMKLDDKDLEMFLYREISEMKDEIVRQMKITETLTKDLKGNKKSYLEIENEKVEKVLQELKINFENSKMENISSGEKLVSDGKSEFEGSSMNKNCKQELKNILNNSNSKAMAGTSNDFRMLTRHKLNQISSGTLHFKLGMDNSFKTYVNQYTTNPIALNKPQRNEERDKKRHLSHKFSLTAASEFKWMGTSSGTLNHIITTLRQTLLTFEQSIASPFMNPNWQGLRKTWVAAVTNCTKPTDFSCVLIILQACFKSVIFANVWHEQLGHTKLQRITSTEREEKKKSEKREKREREDEEERNRLAYNYVKYSLGLKHQVWKQKGEEYRIHGQWGWIWMSYSRRTIKKSIFRDKIIPTKILIHIEKDGVGKIIAVDPKTFAFIRQCKGGRSKDCNIGIPEEFKRIKILSIPDNFDNIDVSKALSIPGRLFYPKVARKSKLDDLLMKREQLREFEEERITYNKIKKDYNNIVESNDKKPSNSSTNNFYGEQKQLSTNSLLNQTNHFERQLIRIAGNKANVINNTYACNINVELLNSFAKKIALARFQFTQLNKYVKQYRCYAKGCNTNSNMISQIGQYTCYSPICLQKAIAKKELLTLLRKAHSVGNGSKETVAAIIGVVKKPSILEQKLMEGKKDIISLNDIDDYRCINDMPVDLKQDFKNSLSNSIQYDEMTILKCITEKCDQMNYIETDVKSEKNIENQTASANEEYDKLDINISYSENSNSSNDIEKNNIKEELNKSDIEVLDMRFESLYNDNARQTRRLTRSNRSKLNNVKNIDKVNLTDQYNKINSPTTNISSHVQKFNRRFALTTSRVKKEDLKFEKEFAPDGSEKIYSATSPRGKIYLVRSVNDILHQKPVCKHIQAKFPIITDFSTHKVIRTLLTLPRHELLKLARHAGKLSALGFHNLAKNNTSVWPYPCSRPLFKTCWLFRTSNLKTLSAVALQFRILWCCLRWDDMLTKPSSVDGKHQMTTETEIVTLELLKHRHIGKFSEKTQYLRRKIVIPLELPKTVREVTSIRSGLRKRKRAESPQKTEPQVTEEWVDEEKLELWEVKLFGERQEKTVTRTVSGKLPAQRQVGSISSTENLNQLLTVNAGTNASDNIKTTVGHKATTEEIKEKMEQQLRLQRAVHNQKRSLEVIKQVSQKPNIIGNRRIIVKNPDGTTKIIHQTISAPPQKQLQPSAINDQSNVSSTATTTPSTTQTQTAPQQTAIPHKVQIIRGLDGKVSVRGLSPGQQLIQMPDGKLHVLTTTPGSGNKTAVLKPSGCQSQTKTVVTTKSPIATQIANKQHAIKQYTNSKPSPPVTVKQIAQTKNVAQKMVVNAPTLIQTTEIHKNQPNTTSALQKIITSTGHIINSPTQKIVTSTANFQQLLVQPGHKLLVRQNAQGQKVLISSPSQQTQATTQQILVQNTQPTTHAQQQVVINQGGQQKVVQQILNTGNTQQHIVVGGQRILLSPGQTVVTQRTVQQTTPVSAQSQVQVLQQQIIHPTQQTQQIIQQPHVPSQSQVQSQHVVQTKQQQTQVVTHQIQPVQHESQVVQQQQPLTVQPRQIQPQSQQSQQHASHAQVIVQNSTLAQQLAQGKLQVATVNSQQVIIRPLGNNQAQIVAHIKTQSDGNAHIVTNSNFTVNSDTVAEIQLPAKPIQSQRTQFTATNFINKTVIQNIQQPILQQQQQISQTPVVQQQSTSISSIEQSLLQGQPPGTVIKCVTAQVIQTEHGPRIVLQGLAGNDFTQQQLALVQQQVKQQLLKAQESSGKQGVLGPTKIYLAVQPSANNVNQLTQDQPPPLTPVQPSTQQQVNPAFLSSNDISKQNVKDAIIYPESNKEGLHKIVTSIQKKLQKNQDLPKFQIEPKIKVEKVENLPPCNLENFVLTPDYIQQTIKNALKQDNLNPEIEEKLISLQRYQEKQMKSSEISYSSLSLINENTSNSTFPSSPARTNLSKKRLYNIKSINGDEEWIADTTRKKQAKSPLLTTTPGEKKTEIKVDPNINKAITLEEKDGKNQQSLSHQHQSMNTKKIVSNKRENEKRKLNYQLSHRLYRHKELLKKEIFKKRGLLEKELQTEIQKELTAELSFRIKSKQEKQDNSITSLTLNQNNNVNQEVRSSNYNSTRRSQITCTSNANVIKKQQKDSKNSTAPVIKKKEKLYCICRTPYDDTKFYVGCDLCNNWFHGDCVGITEEASKKLSEFICDECKHARETQELYCLCKQPYDESQFYICCDKCQDWFHGRCVGILQSEAEYIDEYICPNCQRNNSVNFANMKNLTQNEYDNLKKLMKQIQAHKNAWPFMEPVDPEEAPDYYKIIKEPMGMI